MDALFDSLTRLSSDGTMAAVPALARSWESNVEATAFTFDIHPGARWHDGTPVLAADVVRGLQRVADGTLSPPSLHAQLLEDVDGFAAAQQGLELRGVRAESDRVVRINLTRPVPELPEILAHPALAPVPASAVEDPDAFGEGPVGNGPFRLADAWAHNQFLRLVPFDEHPTPPQLDAVVFRIYADDAEGDVRYADLAEGQVQVAALPAGRRDEARALVGVPLPSGGTGLHSGITGTVSMLLFDTRQPPFDDVDVRRAVSLLVDRTSLAGLTDGARAHATSLVPPSLPGAQPGACVTCRLDQVEAQQLLDDALARLGVPDDPQAPEPVGDDDAPDTEGEQPELQPVLIQTSDDELHGRLADQLAVGLRQAGLSVQVRRVQPGEYLAAAEEQPPAILRLGWTVEYPSLRGWTQDLFAGGELGARMTGWQPPALTDLLGRARSSPDTQVRQELWQLVERLALDEAVVSPVLFYRRDLVVGPGVRGLLVDALGNVDLAAVTITEDGS